MNLLNSDKAQVPEAKITGYLLSLVHEDGRAKAPFFLHFGFSLEVWQELAVALKKHGQEHPVKGIEKSPFGKQYIIEGTIETPDGQSPFIRSIWFIEYGTEIPRLVTAYPLRRKI